MKEIAPVIITVPGVDQSPIGLGPGYIAAVTEKKGIQTTLSQCEEIENGMPHPSIIGISTTSHTIQDANHLAVEFKKKFPTSLLVAGGHGATEKKGQELLLEAFDFLIAGEGFRSFPEFAHAWLTHNIEGAKCTKGLVYKKDNGTLVVNPPSPLVMNLDLLPYPKRENLLGERYIIETDGEVKLAYGALKSLGCYGTCDFCHSNRGTTYRKRTPANVAGEINDIIDSTKQEKDSTYFFHFRDDNFLGDAESGEWLDTFVEKLTESANKNGVEILIDFQARANDILTFQQAISQATQKGFLGHVNVGVESYADEILSRWRKGGPQHLDMRKINIEVANFLTQLHKKYGTLFSLYHILGDANSTLEEMENGLPLAAENQLFDPLLVFLHTLQIHKLRIYYPHETHKAYSDMHLNLSRWLEPLEKIKNIVEELPDSEELLRQRSPDTLLFPFEKDITVELVRYTREIFSSFKQKKVLSFGRQHVRRELANQSAEQIANILCTSFPDIPDLKDQVFTAFSDKT